MEMETDDHLPFLDIDIYRRANGSLGHTVYLNSSVSSPPNQQACHTFHTGTQG
jgi:hypothetical protein